jgi:DNA-binding MurR/RpiR family transcriptional regulator
VIAVDAQYRLSQLGLWAAAYTDILFMNVSASNAGPEDVVLAISHSGRTKAVVDAVRSAKKSGAKVLSLTSFADSPLYRESDLSVAVYADETNYPVEAVSARLSHLCLVDAITMILATKNFDSFAKHIHSRNQILENIRYQGGTNDEKSNSDLN